MLFSYPLLALGLGALVWLLLWISVPMESLHDIVGSPILRWPWHWEVLLRFMMLQLPFVVIGTGAAVMLSASTTGQLSTGRATARWLLLALPLLGLAHLVVVSRAATDNLTELMEDGGNLWSSLALGTWILVCTFSAYLIAAALSKRAFALTAVVTLTVSISFPLGYGLLAVGLEDWLLKYGRGFSALQFLLSPDRNQLFSGAALALRYGQFHALWLTALVVLSLPVWIATRPRTSSVPSMSRAPFYEAAPTEVAALEVNGAIGAEAQGGYRVVRLHRAQIDVLDQLSKRMNTSVAKCLHRILDEYVANHEKTQGVQYANNAGPPLRSVPPRTGDVQVVDVWFPGAQLNRVEQLAQARPAA